MTTGFPLRERGSALLMAVLPMLAIAAFIATSSAEMLSAKKAVGETYADRIQARSLAEAGLVDAYAWFRRQTVQPVTAFAPRRDLAANPPVNETDDASRGLVREFQLSTRLWGRYEVVPFVAEPTVDDPNYAEDADPEPSVAEPAPDELSSLTGRTRDVTRERGLPGAGMIWFVECRGTLFARPRADLPLGQGDNVALASVVLASEVRRLQIAPPAEAVLCAEYLDQVVLGSDVRFGGAASPIAGPADSGEATTVDPAYPAYGGTGNYPPTGEPQALDTTRSIQVPNYESSFESVYGVDFVQLRAMADYSTHDGIEGIPFPCPDNSLIVIEGDVTFTADDPLLGKAIVVVQGNVTIEQGSNSSFVGVLHTAGDLTIRGPASLRGTVIAGAKVDIAGYHGDAAELVYDPNVIQDLMRMIGQYRLSKATYEPGEVLADGRPADVLGPDAPPDGETGDPDPTPLPEDDPKVETLADVIDVLADIVADNRDTDIETYADLAHQELTAAEKALQSGKDDEALTNVDNALEGMRKLIEGQLLPASELQDVIQVCEQLQQELMGMADTTPVLK